LETRIDLDAADLLCKPKRQSVKCDEYCDFNQTALCSRFSV